MTPKLGRIKSPTDYRDHGFLASAVARPSTATHRRWFVPGAWDQGDSSMCVAFSSMLYLNAGPVRNKDSDSGDTSEFYDAVRAIDGFPIPHEGSTVRAAMQLLQSRGYLSEYRWAFTVPDAMNWILDKGPMCFGTDWLDSMFGTTQLGADSFINFDDTSPVAGGHAYLVFGVNKKKKCPDGSIGAFEMQNSWGSLWGNQGRAWLSFKAAAALLAEDGEAACASEVLRKPAGPG